MPQCLVCNAGFEPFISFGRMPIANGFLAPDQFSEEYFFELKAGFCKGCAMVQLAELVDREKMFHDQYPFFTSTSSRMAAHFKEFADSVCTGYLRNPDPFVVEIGSNDGTMLRHFAARGIRHLGFEPSANVAQAAVAQGVTTTCSFFDQQSARKAVEKYGQADAFLASNVMCHIPTLHSVLEGIAILLKPDGVVLFEDPYLGDIIEKTAYDQIYDEHAFYFSASSVSSLFARHGLAVVDVQPQAVHGGSMRYVIARQGAHPVRESVSLLLAKEERLGLMRRETYDRFRSDVERSRRELVALLQSLRSQGNRVVGYAATSKSTTVINYCGLTTDLLEFISDTTPIKQGKFSPGAHIPVRPHESFAVRYPDYALLFGWNHAEEIMAKEHNFRAAGGKWILYVPHVHVTNDE